MNQQKVENAGARLFQTKTPVTVTATAYGTTQPVIITTVATCIRTYKLYIYLHICLHTIRILIRKCSYFYSTVANQFLNSPSPTTCKRRKRDVSLILEPIKPTPNINQ